MINLLFNDNMVGESLSPQITRMSLIVDNEEIQSEDEDMHEINEKLIKVDLGNTKISISLDLPLTIENDISDTTLHFKNALMATIDTLKNTIEFLKNELEEKNLLIRTLLVRDTDDDPKVDLLLLEESNLSNTKNPTYQHQ